MLETGRVLEAAGCAQEAGGAALAAAAWGSPRGSFCCGEAPPATQRLPSRTHEAPSWAVLQQPACGEAGSALSSLLCSLEVDVALTLDQKRSGSTINSFFFFF